MKKIFFLISILCFTAGISYARVPGEVDVKGGILASPYLNVDNKVFDVDLGFTLGIEAYLFCSENLALGLGVTHLFDTDIENSAKKMNYNDFFVSIKPRIPLKGEEIDYLYFTGQLGANNTEIKFIDGDCSTGFYVAGGVGVEAGHLILEVIYSYREWTNSNKAIDKVSFYTLAFNIGCKFSL